MRSLLNIIFAILGTVTVLLVIIMVVLGTVEALTFVVDTYIVLPLQQLQLINS